MRMRAPGCAWRGELSQAACSRRLPSRTAPARRPRVAPPPLPHCSPCSLRPSHPPAPPPLRVLRRAADSKTSPACAPGAGAAGRPPPLLLARSGTRPPLRAHAPLLHAPLLASTRGDRRSAPQEAHAVRVAEAPPAAPASSRLRADAAAAAAGPTAGPAAASSTAGTPARRFAAMTIPWLESPVDAALPATTGEARVALWAVRRGVSPPATAATRRAARARPHPLPDMSPSFHREALTLLYVFYPAVVAAVCFTPALPF